MTREVLPSIRKTGAYELPKGEVMPLQGLLGRPELGLDAAEPIRDALTLQHRLVALQREIGDVTGELLDVLGAQLVLHGVERLDEPQLELQGALAGEAHGEEREAVAGHVEAGLLPPPRIEVGVGLKIQGIPLSEPVLGEIPLLIADGLKDVVVSPAEHLGDLPAVRHRHTALLEDDVGPRERAFLDLSKIAGDERAGHDQCSGLLGLGKRSEPAGEQGALSGDVGARDAFGDGERAVEVDFDARGVAVGNCPSP